MIGPGAWTAALALALPLAALGGSPSRVKPTESPSSDWKLVRSVANPLGGTVDFVLIPEKRKRDRAHYLEIASAVCGKRANCMVNFWSDPKHIPRSAEMPVVDLRLMTATY